MIKNKSIKLKSRLRLKLLISLLFLLSIILSLFTIYACQQNKVNTEGMGYASISQKNVLIPNTNTSLPLLPLILGLLIIMVLVTVLLIIKQKKMELEEASEYNRMVLNNKIKISENGPTVSPNEFNLKGRRV